MRVLSLFLLVAFMVAASSCAPVTSATPPPEWVRIDAPKFSFYMPPDMKSVPVQGVDSFVGAYQSDSVFLNLDYGRYSDPLDRQDLPNYIAHEESIGGKKARIVSYRHAGGGNSFEHAIGVHFPAVGPDGVRLTLYATCKTESGYEIVRTIFRTIQFK